MVFLFILFSHFQLYRDSFYEFIVTILYLNYSFILFYHLFRRLPTYYQKKQKKCLFKPNSKIVRVLNKRLVVECIFDSFVGVYSCVNFHDWGILVEIVVATIMAIQIRLVLDRGYSVRTIVNN